jgi:hypothetical protein
MISQLKTELQFLLEKLAPCVQEQGNDLRNKDGLCALESAVLACISNKEIPSAGEKTKKN